MSSLIHDKSFFRLLGDFMHLSSKVILLATIHIKRSGEGISLLTQALYLLVFLTRYLDLFWTFYNVSKLYNTIFKLTYIGTSIWTLYILLRVFPRSRETEKQYRVAVYIMAFAGLIAPFAAWIDASSWKAIFHPTDVLWAFSIALESLCILPQMNLLRYIDIPTAITSYYMVALGSYRFFYLINWFVAALSKKQKLYPVPVLFGIIQTWLYVEFALVYYRRQKIRLRTGAGMLDDEDFRSGGLVLGQLLGGATGGRWNDVERWIGRRTGLSVNADHDTLDAERDRARRANNTQEDAEEGRARAAAGPSQPERDMVLSSDSEDEEGSDEDEGLIVDQDAKRAGGNVWRQ